MRREPDVWMLIVFGTALAAGVMIIFLLLPSTPSPRAELMIELAKILAAGLVVGVLGAWAKQVLERGAEKRRELAVRASANKKLFAELRTAAREALNSLEDPKLSDASSFDALMGGARVDFEGLLDRWDAFEPGASKAIRSSYHTIRTEFNVERLSPAFRKRAEKEIRHWLRQFGLMAARW